jgi:hypothetical protein
MFWQIPYHSYYSIKVVTYADVERRRGYITVFILNSERNEITEGADSLTIIVCIYPEEGTTYRYIAGEAKVLRQFFCFVCISIQEEGRRLIILIESCAI